MTNPLQSWLRDLLCLLETDSNWPESTPSSLIAFSTQLRDLPGRRKQSSCSSHSHLHELNLNTSSTDVEAVAVKVRTPNILLKKVKPFR